MLAFNKKLLFVTVATTCAFLAGFILTELSARLIHAVKSASARHRLSELSSYAYEKPGQSYDTYDALSKMEYNTYLGYVPKSNYVGKGYRTNSQHLRYDKALPEKKDANEVRVFVTGGSAAWGAGVPQEELYSVLMEETLSRKYPKLRIRVISAGIGAYCSTQERILVENLLIRLKPDYIVMFSGWNDSYYGYIGTDTALEQDYFNYKAKVSGDSSRDITPFSKVAPPQYDKYWLKTRFFFDKFRYKQRFKERADLLNKVSSVSLQTETVIEGLFRNIHILNDLSRRYKFRLIFYLQPTIHSTEKTLTSSERQIAADFNLTGVGFSDYNRQVYKMYRTLFPVDSRKEGYDFVDGDQAIRYEKEAVFADQVHFGDRGNRLIAEHMGNILSARLYQ